MPDNRWFTKEGKRKRVPVKLEPLQPFAKQCKTYLLQFSQSSSIAMPNLVREAHRTFELGSITDSLNFVIAFVGMYNNVDFHGAFTMERFEHGLELIEVAITKIKEGTAKWPKRQ